MCTGMDELDRESLGMASLLIDIYPYPAYKPSAVPWLGDVPAHWEIRRLKQLCSQSALYGANIAATQYQEDGVRFLRTTDITDEGHLRPRGVFLSEELVRGYLLRDKDLLISRSGTVGRSFLYQSKLHGPCAYAGYLVRFVPNELVLPEYILQFTRTQAFDGFLRIMAISSTIENVNADKYANAHLTLPPLPEQAAIVRYLDHVDRRIRRYVSAKRKLIALLEEERKFATLEAMQSPNTTSRRLEVVTDLVQRPIERASDETYTPIGLYNRGRGMFRKEPRCGNDLGDSNFFWIEEGDLVISGQFAWEGAIALASDVEHGCVASHRYPILRGKPGILDSGFLMEFFQTGWGQLLLDHNSRGAAGRNRPLNARSLMKEQISLPPIETQLRIAGMLQLESHVRQQARLSEQLLNEYRTRLIADVVTGKLDVREAAAQLPDESDDEEPIDEGRALADDADGDLHDGGNFKEESAMESEVRA